jgi:hypothetical protein
MNPDEYQTRRGSRGFIAGNRRGGLYSTADAGVPTHNWDSLDGLEPETEEEEAT